MTIPPLAILLIGIVTVVGMILVLRLNAFLALITAAILVSLLAPGALDEKISRVAVEFGVSAGKIGIVIALAAVIGQCMMDSGAADRIVRAFLSLLGEKRASVALLSSGYVLGIPVFFDTVFYLLVPLARSLYRRTGKHYLKFLLAIGAGGAITHTLVPPTPGPLAMAGTLGVNIGNMILVGALVALPSAIVGLLFAGFMDRIMPVPMRPIGTETEGEIAPESEAELSKPLPSFGLSILPVVLPVLLISANTVLDTLTREKTPPASSSVAVAAPSEVPSGAGARRATRRTWSRSRPPRSRTHPPRRCRRAAAIAALVGDPNLALLLAAAVAMLVYYRQCGPTLDQLAHMVETSLMSGGIIILITSAGGAFGAMLRESGINQSIEGWFASDSGQVAGMTMMLLGFGVSAVLKIAQGSSTVAMITASGILAAMLPEGRRPGLRPGLPGHRHRRRVAGRLVDERQRLLGRRQDGRPDRGRGPEIVDPPAHHHGLHRPARLDAAGDHFAADVNRDSGGWPWRNLRRHGDVPGHRRALPKPPRRGRPPTSPRVARTVQCRG